MLDHVGLKVSDFARAQAFYDQALTPLGLHRLREFPGVAGYGDARPFFWISAWDGPIQGVHVAFAAENRDLVTAFHAAALAAGGRDNGGPGLRPMYHPNYYGAFVLDPDGHNVEAVCGKPAP